MNKAMKPLAVSKDLVNELQRLAIAADKDTDAYDNAKAQLINASTAVLTSTSQFAVALYDFTLRYAESPKLITAQLDTVGLQYKSTSSVYVHIARLACLKLPETDAKRQRISYYGKLIETAHSKGKSSDEFKALVSSGLTKALQKLDGTVVRKPMVSALQRGRELASEFLSGKSFETKGISPKVEVPDGSEVQLLARWEGGRFTVYGMIPPDIVEVDSVLAKLARDNAPKAIKLGDFLPEMMRLLKLVWSTSDSAAEATYREDTKGVHFIAKTTKGTAIVSAPLQYAVFKDNLSMPLNAWKQLLSTLIPLRQHISDVGIKGTQCVVEVDSGVIRSISEWMETKRKPIGIGKASGTTLTIPLQKSAASVEDFAGRTETLAIVESGSLAGALKVNIDKKFAVVTFPSKAEIKLAGAPKNSGPGIHLSKGNFRQFKSVCTKFSRWSNELTFQSRKGELRVSVTLPSTLTYALRLQVE